ncbi:hypothetical protein JL721_1531 [Aureococcus anophagefferens]|nr:hypothetical protein JL721_1531 [Aureococcus anophagefferens]
MGAGASSKTAFEADAERYASKAKAEAKDAEAHAAAMATTVKGLALAEKHELHVHCQKTINTDVSAGRTPLSLGKCMPTWKSLADHPSAPPAKGRAPGKFCAEVVAELEEALLGFVKHLEALVVHTVVGFEHAAAFCFSDLSFSVALDPVPMLQESINLTATVSIDASKLGEPAAS